MRTSTNLELQPISAIPETVLTAIELQLQRALVADLMQRIAVLEYRLQRAERRDNQDSFSRSSGSVRSQGSLSE